MTILDIVKHSFSIFKDVNIEVKEDEEQFNDEEQEGNVIVIDGWIYLIPRKAVKPKEHQHLHWDVNYGYVIHGVRYYKDGSGEPDDYDYKEIGVDLELMDAIKLAWATMIENAINIVLENAQEEEDFHKDYEEF